VLYNKFITNKRPKEERYIPSGHKTALEMTDLHYPEDWLRAYTDGSQADKANSAGAGVHCQLFLHYATVGINKSNFDGELGAICLAVQQLFKQFLPTAKIKEDK